MAYSVVVAVIVAILLLFQQIEGRELGSSSNNSFLEAVIVFSMLALLMGLRSASVGSDTITYLHDYEAISDVDYFAIFMRQTGYSMEPAYLAMMKACSSIGISYYAFQVIVACVYCAGMARFLLRSSISFEYCIFGFLAMGLYLEAFNITRQMLAVMLALNCWVELRASKYLRSALFFVIAYLIHTISLVFIIAIVLTLAKEHGVFLRVFVPLVLVAVTIFIITNYEIILQTLKDIPSSYGNYLSNHKQKHTAGFVVILWLIIAALSIVVLVDKGRFANEHAVFAICSLIAISFQLIGFYVNYIERLSLYFVPFTVLLFDVFGSRLGNYRNFYYICSGGCFIAYFILSSSTAQYAYSSFLMA